MNIQPPVEGETPVVKGEGYNYSCDVYSFGVIAYTLIVGSLPFKVESENFFDKKIVWVMF